MTKEAVQRLTPKFSTLRELYLKSGNQCAFPSCQDLLFDGAGAFIGQICHIEAAEEGGQRFNENMTNQQRRHVSNLILLCANHHIKTNDVNVYTVGALKVMKAEHEGKYVDVIGKMRAKVVDHTTQSAPKVPSNLKKFHAHHSWKFSAAEEKDELNTLSEVIQKLSKVPIPSRQCFAMIVRKSYKDFDGWKVAVAEIQQAADLSDQDLRQYLSILDRHGLTKEGHPDDFGLATVALNQNKHQVDDWPPLREFCDANSIDLDDLIVDLDFSSLEG